MPNSLVTLETLPNPERARFIQGLLESEGVPASLADEAAGGMMWHLNNAIGGIKVQVTEADIPRAQEILEAHRAIRLAQRSRRFTMRTASQTQKAAKAMPMMAQAVLSMS